MLGLDQQSFWQFCLNLYKNKEVEQLLLSCQEQKGLNVNLALFCAWLNKQKLYIRLEQLTLLNSAISEFNKCYTKKIRSLRRSLKIEHFNSSHYPHLRAQLLNVELEFEKVEQTSLLDAFKTISVDTCSTIHKDNLALYEDNFSCQPQPNATVTKSLTDLNQHLS